MKKLATVLMIWCSAIVAFAAPSVDNGLSEEVAHAELGGQLAGRILGSLILAYIFMALLWLVYKLLQGAISLLSNGKCQLKNLQYKVPWWVLLLLFAGNFCSFTEGWQNIPGLMCFGLIVCLAIVLTLWRKQRHAKQKVAQTEPEAKQMKSFRLAPLTPHDKKQLKEYAVIGGIFVLAVIIVVILGMTSDRLAGQNKAAYRQDKFRRVAVAGAFAQSGKTPRARATRGLVGMGLTIAEIIAAAYNDHVADEQQERLEALQNLSRGLPQPVKK